jgi:hypothetical protein
MRMPMESSELDQMVRLTPSQVGSCVLVMAFSSMVLNIEHIVALLCVSSGSLIGDVEVNLRDTEQENDANTQLSSTV